MRVFVTGATGFIGSAVVKELLGAGHEVVGMTRSDKGAEQLSAAGATPHRGTLDDLDSLRAGAAKAEGVIHLAFIHEFSDAPLLTRAGVIAKGLMGRGLVPSFLSVLTRTDTAAINALSSSLIGTGGPMIITVGTLGLSPGRLVTEADQPDAAAPGAARSVPAEQAAAALTARGVRATVMRLPPSVHDDHDGGFIPRLYTIAKKKGVSAYVDDGSNRWPAVHRLDAARLYRLLLEKGIAGEKYHGVADEGVPFRHIAEVIGRQLNVPVVAKTPAEAAKHFSFLSMFVGADNPTSSALTQRQLDWHPTGPGLLPDIDRAAYFNT